MPKKKTTKKSTSAKQKPKKTTPKKNGPDLGAKYMEDAEARAASMLESHLEGATDLADFINEIAATDKNEKGWSPQDRMKAAMAYSTLGSIMKAAKATGIPRTTIQKWANHSDWWEDLVKVCKKSTNTLLEANLTQLVHLSTSEVVDRVKHGDFYMTTAGELKRKPLSAKDMMMIATASLDKRSLMRGEATKITETIEKNKSTTEIVDSLLTVFSNMVKPQSKLIEAEVVEEEEDNGNK